MEVDRDLGTKPTFLLGLLWLQQPRERVESRAPGEGCLQLSHFSVNNVMNTKTSARLHLSDKRHRVNSTHLRGAVVNATNASLNINLKVK